MSNLWQYNFFISRTKLPINHGVLFRYVVLSQINPNTHEEDKLNIGTFELKSLSITNVVILLS